MGDTSGSAPHSPAAAVRVQLSTQVPGKHHG